MGTKAKSGNGTRGTRKMMAIAEFRKRGCQYAQPRWQPSAALQRLNEKALAKFGKRSVKPWAKVDRKSVEKVFRTAGKLADERPKSTPLVCTLGTAVKAPSASAWSAKKTSPSPVRSGPGPVQSGRGYLPPHRRVQPRNVAPPTQPRNVVPGPIQPRNVAPGPVQPRNVAPGPVQPRHVAPGPVQPRNVAPGPVQPQNVARGPVATRMSRNTSYPVKNDSRSSTRSKRSPSPHFPGRGMPIQSIRGTASRSTSARRSRTPSTEPERPVMSNPRPIGSRRATPP